MRMRIVTGTGSEGRATTAIASAAAVLLLSCGATAAQDTPRVAGTAFPVEEADIIGVHTTMVAGTLTCSQLTRLYLARIAAYDDNGPKLNAVTTINPKALEEATALDRQKGADRTRPLYCIPVLLKDNIDTADMPTTNGSVLLKHARPSADAPIVRRLKQGGALILGKADMGEFAGGSYNTVDGQTINPYNLKRDTGGSSAGSAAAVAANLTLVAVGTDTSTSVRGPASFNGIVGLRPTTGLISRSGIAPKNLNFDTAGPLARTVTDVAILLNVLAGPDQGDPLSVDVFRRAPAAMKSGDRYGDFTQALKPGALRGARLGVLRDFFGGDPEIDALANAALESMRALGAEIVDVRLDPAFFDFYVKNGGTNIRKIADYRFKADWEPYLATLSGPGVPRSTAEFVTRYETEVAKSPLPVEASVLDLLKRALATSTSDAPYQNLISKVLPEATALKLAIFETHKVDALVFPYNPAFASPIRNPTGRVDDPTYVGAKGVPAPSILAGYSSVGFPGIVVPMGFGSQGLPMDISFMGRPYDEGRLIAYAYDYEQATKLRRPSPLVPPLAEKK